MIVIILNQLNNWAQVNFFCTGEYMNSIVYLCVNCDTKVANILKGSSMKRGTGFICDTCISSLGIKVKSTPSVSGKDMLDTFNTIFGNIFPTKKPKGKK